MSVIRFLPMQPEDMPRVVLGPDQAETFGLLNFEQNEDYGRLLLSAGPCWSGFDDDGRIVGAAGFSEVFPTQAGAWAMFSPALASYRVAIVRFVREQLATVKWWRIEALTRAAVPMQGRFARACGFTRVAPLRHCGPTCETMELYERVRDAG